jgi:carboxyl-terminal processing protease
MPLSRAGNLLFQAGVVGVLGAAALGPTLALTQDSSYRFLDPIIETQHLITSRYVDAPDLKKLQEGAIKGMVEALNDPYTVFVPAADTADFTKDLLGEYVGIGASITQRDGWLEIVSPLEDSPSYRAGLMAEDRISEIEGVSTQNVPIDECIKRLMGEPGTKVKITVSRKGETLNFELTRAKIKTLSVKGFHREAADGSRWMFLMDPARKVAYIRLTQFTPKCSDEVLNALVSVGADRGELKGLILDLRFNPGGILEEAIRIADLFLKDGVIVSTRGRAHPEEVARAQEPGTLPDFPIAIMLNGSSASASEVLAGALVDNNRAIVVGTRSFGKGSVQTVRQLDRGGGAELKMTEQGYFLPSGRSITRKDDSATWGVDPTDGFYVPVADDDIRAMLEVRRRLEVLRPENAGPENANLPAGADQIATEDWTNSDWILDTLKDSQLTAAMRAVQNKIDSGEWKKTGEALNQGAQMAASEISRLRTSRDRLERELERTDIRLDALERGAGQTSTAAASILPSGSDIRGGTLEIRDKSGKLVQTLEITSNNIALWLADAGLKPKTTDAGPAAESSPNANPK